MEKVNRFLGRKQYKYTDAASRALYLAQQSAKELGGIIAMLAASTCS